MIIKKKRRISSEFSMASMTDLVFLLLIFLMITSTIVIHNSVKIILPESTQCTHTNSLLKVIIDKNLFYYVALENKKEKRVSFEGVVSFLQKWSNKETCVTICADESIQYAEVMKILDIVNKNYNKVILAVRQLKEK